MNRRSFLVGFGLAVMTFSAIGQAAADAWALLGTRQVNWQVDHDTIPIGAARGRFDHIQLLVKGNDLFLYDLKVIYGNGAVDDIPVRLLIPQGGKTRVIDLRGGDRLIRAVSMTYQKPVNLRGPTYVEVWGQR